jgi:uncharacterized SAM-binding protein YcdF (DUF218 family)
VSGVYADAIIILGKHMPGGRADDDALERAKAGARLWIDGRSPAVIPCGGQREDEPIPEADWLASELSRLGVPPTVIHPERESLNTEQNLAFAKRMMDGWGGGTALIVTSAAHMPRALAVSRSIGLRASGWPVIAGDGGRLRAHMAEWLGWIEWKLGWQRVGRPAWLSGVARFAHRITRS